MLNHVIFAVKVAIVFVLVAIVALVLLVTIAVVCADPGEQIEHSCMVRVIDDLRIPCAQISEKV